MSKKGFRALIALIVVCVFVAGICCMGFASRGTDGSWFGNFKDLSTWHWSERSPLETIPSEGLDNEGGNDGYEAVSDGNSLIISDVEATGLTLTRSLLAPDEYSAYGIDARGVQSAYKATVTLANGSVASINTISLKVEFAEINDWIESLYGTVSEIWAKDYIHLSKENVQSGEEFIITCSQAFGSPIIITATADGAAEGETQKCSIQADYVARFSPYIMVNIGSDPDNEMDGTFDTELFVELEFVLDDNKTQRIISEYSVGIFSVMSDNTHFAVNVVSFEFDYGVGTIKDTLCLQDYVACDVEIYVQECSEEFDPEFSIVLTGFMSDGKFLFCNDRLHSEWEDVIDRNIQNNAGWYYASILENSRRVTSNLYLEFTSALTGETYRYVADLIVNPQYIFTAAESPSFNIGNIIF